MDSKEAGSGAARHRRRYYSRALKRQIVEEALSGDDSVSIVARRHDVNANQVFKWRRLYRAGELDPQRLEQPALLPVHVAAPLVEKAVIAAEAGRIEIEWRDGGRVVIQDNVSAATLRTVLEALRAC